MKRTIVILLALLLVVVGCRAKVSEKDVVDFVRLDRVGGYSVYRFIDRDMGVVCWLYSHGGLSCLPLSKTVLGGQ